MIAAGEVVENPAGMVKELLENAIDAGGRKILLDVKQGGRSLVIKDDGKGMVRDDLLLSVERHATSKISVKEDLFRLSSYGFRGEALSSVAAVSKMEMRSRAEGEASGNRIRILGGKITFLEETAMNRGTTIEVSDLFYNTPARLKFLRKPNTEYANIKDILIREALANPEIGMTLFLDGKKVVETSGMGLDQTIAELFSAATLRNTLSYPLGRLGNAELFRNNRDALFLFVNGRPVRSKLLEDAILEGYYTKLMKGQYPFAILDLRTDPASIDVNVHPSKKIVKFSNDSHIFASVSRAVREAIEQREDFISPSLSSRLAKEETPVATEAFPALRGENLPMNYEIAEKNFEREAFLSGGNPAENLIQEQFFSEKEEKGVSEDAGPDLSSPSGEFRERPAAQDRSFGIRPPFRVIGQLFRTFILVERNGELEIYDQHIVNERIRYELLKSQYYGKTIEKQLLLIPLRLSIDPRDREILIEHRKTFDDFGFEMEEDPGGDVLIRSAPTFDFRDSIENVFREILQNVKEGKERDIRENILISMACRDSVKANEGLTNEEMTDIIRRLHEIGKYTCPHGRPIFIRITADELQKLFKRKN
jgi:DNA mismatch repair protein MutL